MSPREGSLSSYFAYCSTVASHPRATLVPSDAPLILGKNTADGAIAAAKVQASW